MSPVSSSADLYPEISSETFHWPTETCWWYSLYLWFVTQKWNSA